MRSNSRNTQCDCAVESPSDTPTCHDATTPDDSAGDRLLGRDDLPLIGLALFALAWAIARAHIQFITIDEAQNFLSYVGGKPLTQWYPASNNHVINSLLMLLSTSVFGVSHLSVRLPALLGTAFYITAACAVARALVRDSLGRCVVLVLLVYNPFVFDYLVAARGYSIALACLLGAIAVLLRRARSHAAGRPIRVFETCAAISRLCGLGFSSSFPFAFCFGLVCAVTFTLACLSLKTHAALHIGALLKTTFCCIAPGLALAFVLVGSVVLNWPSGQLEFGARHLSEMWQSVIWSLWYEPNPDMLNPLLLPLVTKAADYFLPCLGLAGLFRLAVLWGQRRHSRSRFALSVFGLCLLVVALLVGIHYFAMRTFQLWLPMERTALFFVPLGFTGICALAMKVGSGKLSLWSRRVLLIVLIAMSAYFIGCMRLRYFREWKYVSDSRAIYEAVLRAHRSSPLTGVSCHWRFTAVLNFYRIANNDLDLPEFPFEKAVGDRHWEGRDLYVCFEPDDAEFIRKEGLTAVYRGSDSIAVVAVRPSHAP